jgi:mannose-6-phosphate isomerase-like protein (cupin superfamily)
MILAGGVQVTGLKDGEPVQEGALRIWNHFQGDKVSLRVLEMESGGRAELYNADQEEVLYQFGDDVAIHLPVRHELVLDGATTMISVRTPATSSATHTLVVTLDERPLQRTGDRSYVELIQGEVTQFVGIIPPGRAPAHYHLYEEVLCILDGEGVMWAGASSAPIATGSCIYLPRGQMHCVENTSSRELRLLGVFYPAGSPAVRYG